MSHSDMFGVEACARVKCTDLPPPNVDLPKLHSCVTELQKHLVGWLSTTGVFALLLPSSYDVKAIASFQAASFAIIACAMTIKPFHPSAACSKRLDTTGYAWACCCSKQAPTSTVVKVGACRRLPDSLRNIGRLSAVPAVTH
jgi:hypothetical protein